ncbi:MAG: hypothetical protein AUI53_06770 [Acidobacteria bacterium 13_1_40CM_2_60_7]|nr:MAG: hypothetical protein AUI53_06770 [Acidobacteria bacterium 13_1_40CM_2_60_7]
MARYSAFLGRRVEVQYRAGDISLPATGTLAADSGRSIFLEESFIQRGKEKHFRWEIPYQCIVRIEERPAVPEPVPPNPSPAQAAARVGAVAAGSRERSSGSSFISLQNRPKEA